MNKTLIYLSLTLAVFSNLVHAQSHGSNVQPLPAITVVGKRETNALSLPLPADENGKIYQGKKTTLSRIDKLPRIAASQQRQVFSQTPGLVVSEVMNRGIVNLTYRGIGDPHEAQDMLLFQDGIPIQHSLHGYATMYYTTPSQLIKGVEFIRGGSSLLYGPQPGPTVNYILDTPSLKSAAADHGSDPKQIVSRSPLTKSDRGYITEFIFGSYDQISSFNKVTFSGEKSAGFGSFLYEKSDGSRSNGDYEIHGGTAKLQWRPYEDSLLTFGLDIYEAEVGEPGRLTLAEYNANRKLTRTRFDRLKWNRFVGAIQLEQTLSDRAKLFAKAWGGYTSRYSTRERFNAARVSLNNANIDLQEFFTGGLDTRLALNWDAWEENHLLAAGFTAVYTNSPRLQKRSALGRLGTFQGQTRYRFDRETYYGALFAENRFQIGRLAIIPAARLELINNRIHEEVNFDKTTAPLINIDDLDIVSLFGLGLEYELSSEHTFYANVSQGYKPPGFDNLAPTGNALAATELEAGKSLSFEIGARGTPWSWLRYDASLFWINYENQFGSFTVAPGISQFRNSGDAYYRGWEGALELDLSALVDQLSKKGDFSDRLGSLILSANGQLLDAKFHSGPLDGKRPDYAPDYLVKIGPIYNYKDKLKLSFTGQIIGGQFWQDSNLPANGVSTIPAFAVFDFTGEMKIYRDTATLIFGVNNVFDRKYYSRVRSDGIEPADGRTYYAGLRLTF
ncbi:MAG: TonB-dependent receptor [Methylacidiphilales bacterium]|nr:TonB-dependent receptor [Candidatus Methylacidiphilales bacterium]MDW8349707.1 TonB-dependent receptor [Verrucomicrobiae bacterium]